MGRAPGQARLRSMWLRTRCIRLLPGFRFLLKHTRPAPLPGCGIHEIRADLQDPEPHFPPFRC